MQEHTTTFRATKLTLEDLENRIDKQISKTEKLQFQVANLQLILALVVMVGLYWTFFGF